MLSRYSMSHQPATIIITLSSTFRVGLRLLEMGQDSTLDDYSTSLLMAKKTFVYQTFCFSYWDSSKPCPSVDLIATNSQKPPPDLKMLSASPRPPHFPSLSVVADKKRVFMLQPTIVLLKQAYVLMSRRCKCNRETSIIVSACAGSW